MCWYSVISSGERRKATVNHRSLAFSFDLQVSMGGASIGPNSQNLFAIRACRWDNLGCRRLDGEGIYAQRERIEDNPSRNVLVPWRCKSQEANDVSGKEENEESVVGAGSCQELSSGKGRHLTPPYQLS